MQERGLPRVATSMIFKSKDPSDGRLRNLEVALQLPLSYQDRHSREKELAIRRAGLKGEKDAAYYIDFHLKDSANWAVIHDLRIEWKGRIAQIDHLIMDRMLEIYVVETKSFGTKVRHANGGWERYYAGDWEGIASPVEQNERHISVLKEIIRETKLAPKRLGVPLPPTYYNMVVVSPECSVIGRFAGGARVLRMDSLVRKVRDDNSGMLNLVKVVKPTTLHRFATRLAALHKPASMPNTVPLAQSGRAIPEPVSEIASIRRCSECGGSISATEASYCRNRQSRFAGRLLCIKCQTYAPKSLPATAAR
jgi:hypothetical protein